MTRYMAQLMALLVLVTTAWSSVQAADVQALSLVWFTADGGGQVAAISSGAEGRFQLNSTFGQPDASSHVQGARFGLNTGFWSELEAAPGGQSNDKVYLPLIRVNN
ncbi:MAG: hypothetical protein R3A44_40435 [Caldilineaceae bacterium]